MAALLVRIGIFVSVASVLLAVIVFA